MIPHNTHRLHLIAAVVALAATAGLAPTLPLARADQPPHRTPPAKAPNPNQPPKVQELLTRQDQGGLAPIIHQLQDRRDPLEPDEIAAISQYLQTRLTRAEIPEPERVGQRWLCQELMCKLMEQKPLPPGAPGLLVAIYHDTQQDDIVRDYALQHMATACQKANPSDRAQMRKTLWTATKETQGTRAASALLALAEVSRHPNGEDPKKVQVKARQMAADDTLPVGPRMTALLVGAELGDEEIIPLALNVAADPAAGPLRVAAVGALGVLRVTEAKPLLEQLRRGYDPRLAHAARAALAKLNAAPATPATP